MEEFIELFFLDILKEYDKKKFLMKNIKLDRAKIFHYLLNIFLYLKKISFDLKKKN